MRMSLPQEGTHSSRGLTYSGAVARGPWGAMAPPIVQSRSQSMPVRGLGSGMTLGKSNLFYPK